MIRTELIDVLGEEYVGVRSADRFGHSVDYYWIPEMWHDRGMETPKPDFVCHPSTTEEVAKIVKIANPRLSRYASRQDRHRKARR